MRRHEKGRKMALAVVEFPQKNATERAKKRWGKYENYKADDGKS